LGAPGVVGVQVMAYVVPAGMSSPSPGWMMGLPDGGPLAGVVTADAMAAKPEIKVAVVKCILAG
jgi:hypothetical protein